VIKHVNVVTMLRVMAAEATMSDDVVILPFPPL